MTKRETDMLTLVLLCHMLDEKEQVYAAITLLCFVVAFGLFIGFALLYDTVASLVYS